MSFKQEALAVLNFYKRNMAHILGEDDERVKVIERCIGMVDEIEEQGWIDVKERTPENTDPVNITWVNHKPEPYYASIKDVPFTATGCYCDGKWYWYSVTCQDYLDEYRYCDVDSMDEKIEVLAWKPLPEAYKGDDAV